MGERPLADVKVLDLSRLLPGPFLTMVLGDLGADVVKIEAPNLGDYLRELPPGKGGINGGFHGVNRNKRSLVLDLKSSGGRDALLRMVERADVLVESFRPGVLDRLGIGYEVLRLCNRGIVVCSISGYGQTGSYRERAGHDLNYLALSGVLAMGGERGGAPGLPGIQIADLAGGALWGSTAVLGALYGRHRTGQGTHLDISMCEGTLALLAYQFGMLDAGAQQLTRGESLLTGGVANYQVYRTADDKWVAVGALEPKFYAELNRVVGRCNDGSSLAESVVSPAGHGDLQRELAAIFVTRTRDQWAELFAQHDACCEPVLELPEVLEHALHAERQVFYTIDDPELGPILQVRTPVTDSTSSRRAPRLGEHSHEVLQEYGFSAAEILALAPDG